MSNISLNVMVKLIGKTILQILFMGRAPWALRHAMENNESLPAEKYAGLGLFLALESKVLKLCFNIRFSSEH